MTARNDLDNAFSILDAGINSHVAALKAAHAAVADESYLEGLTAKVIAFADTLSASNPTVAVAVVPAAVIPDPAPVAPPLPAFLVTAPAPAVTSTPPSVLTTNVGTAEPSTNPAAQLSQPSVLETMEAAVRAMVAKANP